MKTGFTCHIIYDDDKETPTGIIGILEQIAQGMVDIEIVKEFYTEPYILVKPTKISPQYIEPFKFNKPKEDKNSKDWKAA